MSHILHFELLKPSQWCRANKLSINLKKNLILWFLSLDRRGKNLKIKIRDKSIEGVKETIFSGAIVDENFPWKLRI